MAAPLPALDELAPAMAATTLNEFSPAIAATAPDVLAPARRTELATAARCPPRGRALPPSRPRAPSRHGSVGARTAAPHRDLVEPARRPRPAPHLPPARESSPRELLAGGSHGCTSHASSDRARIPRRESPS